MSITEITERAVLAVPIDRVWQVAVSGSRHNGIDPHLPRVDVGGCPLVLRHELSDERRGDVSD